MPGTRSTKPVWCRPTHGYIGRIPRSSEGGTEWTKAAAYLRTHQRAHQIFAFSGPTDDLVNSKNGSYYIIHREAPRFDAGTTRDYTHQVLAWRGCAGETDQAIRYYRNYSDLLTYLDVYERPIDTLEPDDDLGDRCRGQMVTFRYPQPIGIGDYNQPAFTAAKMRLQNMKAAAVGVWSMPDVALDEDNQILREWHCRPNMNIRGYSTAVDAKQPQLGNLRKHVYNQGDDSLDTVEAATRRCLFQTGHPVGFWTNETTYQDINGSFRFPVYPRNLLRCASNDTRVVVCLPACVVTCDEGAKIRYTIGTSTWEWEAFATYATPQLIFGSKYTGDCLEATTGDDETRHCRVQIKAPAGGEILLHTTSLWEWKPYPATHSAPG